MTKKNSVIAIRMPENIR